jgi:hypothetical protein
MNVLGRDYIVWDKAAEIDFIKPGTGRVHARFLLTDTMLEAIHQHTADGNKYLPCWPVTIINDDGETVAKINKTLYIRKKPRS